MKYMFFASLLFLSMYAAESTREQAEQIYHKKESAKREQEIRAIQDELDKQEFNLVKIPCKVCWFIVKKTSQCAWYLTRCSTKCLYHAITDYEDFKYQLSMKATDHIVGLITLAAINSFATYLLVHQLFLKERR